MHICLSWPRWVNSLSPGVYCCNFEHNNAQRMLVWLFRWINSKKYSFCYYTKLLGGILVSLRPSALLSVCLSVCPSVSPASRVHSLAPTVLVGSISNLYQATSEGVSLVKLLEKFHNLNFWQLFKICSFDFVLFWLRICCESLVWVIMGWRGVSQNAGILVILVVSDIPNNLVYLFFNDLCHNNMLNFTIATTFNNFCFAKLKLNNLSELFFQLTVYLSCDKGSFLPIWFNFNFNWIS